MKMRALAFDQASQQIGVIFFCGTLGFLGIGFPPLLFTHQFRKCSCYFVAVFDAHAPEFIFDSSDRHGAKLPQATGPSNPPFLP